MADQEEDFSALPITERVTHKAGTSSQISSWMRLISE